MSNSNTNASANTSTNPKGTSRSKSGTLDNTNTNANTQKTTSLPNDYQQRLIDMAKQLELQINSRSSDYLTIGAGETQTLLFNQNPEKYQKVTVTYQSKAEGSTPSKPTERMKFFVKVADSDGNIADDAPEQEWTTSLTVGRDIVKWMSKGFLLLDIERQGAGKTDTKYFINPHM